MVRIFKVVGIFSLGLVVGMTIMAFLASRASITYSRGLQSLYSFDQQRQGALAAKSSQWLKAAIAYHNVAAAADADDNQPFGVENDWDPWFPFASLILEKVHAAADPEGKGRRNIASFEHAKYALVLERGGRRTEAANEWDKALSYGFFKSHDMARETASKDLDREIKFFSEH